MSGVSAPRIAIDGSDLPSARDVSITVHRPEYRGDYDFTVMLAVWGQFLDHDVTATALSQGKLLFYFRNIFKNLKYKILITYISLRNQNIQINNLIFSTQVYKEVTYIEEIG